MIANALAADPLAGAGFVGTVAILQVFIFVALHNPSISAQNPNIEIRNKNVNYNDQRKQIRSKIQFGTCLFLSFGYLNFGFVSNFVLRISGLRSITYLSEAAVCRPVESWLKITPANTVAAARYCMRLNFSPSISQPRIIVKTGIRLINAVAWLAGSLLTP